MSLLRSRVPLFDWNDKGFTLDASGRNSRQSIPNSLMVLKQKADLLETSTVAFVDCLVGQNTPHKQADHVD